MCKQQNSMPYNKIIIDNSEIYHIFDYNIPIMSNLLKVTKFIFVNSLVFFILLEFVAFIMIQCFHNGLPPEAYLAVNETVVEDRDQTFGVWHKANSATTAIGPCWSVNYTFNSAGARDAERKLNTAKPRFLLLGDSFFEGYGVAYINRFQQILEKKTGTEFMSFASSGNFGLTQMQLLYDSLACKY
jgi:hypothetical protein